MAEDGEVRTDREGPKWGRDGVRFAKGEPREIKLNRERRMREIVYLKYGLDYFYSGRFCAVKLNDNDL